ncbi:MAG: hypothetical protein AAGC63_13040 [Propionicimonas sp.]|nr:hypothetical protein [Propionicimonas sp.]
MGRAVRALMALVVAMLALSGCAGKNPTHAADVNGVVITEAQVDGIAQGLANVAGTPQVPGENRKTAASVLIRNEVGRQIGQQQGIAISDADRQAALDSSPTVAKMAGDPLLSSFIDDYLTSELVRIQLGDEAFAAASEQIPVLLNPRYGTWNASQGMLDDVSGSLSSPAPAANA